MAKANVSKKSTKAETKAVETAEKKPVEVDISKYDQYKTKADKIRAMHADGIGRSMIAKLLDIRYQHVRNVLTQPLKKPVQQTA